MVMLGVVISFNLDTDVRCWNLEGSPLLCIYRYQKSTLQDRRLPPDPRTPNWIQTLFSLNLEAVRHPKPITTRQT